MVINDYRASQGGTHRKLQESERDDALMGHYDGYAAAAMQFAPYNPDALIGTRGYQILDEQMHQSAVRTPLNILRTAVLRKGATTNSAIKDENADPERYQIASERAKHLEYDLAHIEDKAGNRQSFVHDVSWELLYGIHVGFRVSEIIWRLHEDGPYRGKLGWSMFAAKPAKQIGFDLDPDTFAVRNITSYTALRGQQLNIPVEKVVRFTFAPKDGLPYGSGMGRTVYKHSWSIDFLLKFWNAALEIFGTPFLLAFAEQTNLKKVREVLAKIRQGAPAAFPKGTEVELMQIAAGGLAAFKQAIEWHSQQATYDYLFNTLTSGTDDKSGARSLGEVHQDTQELNFAFLREMLAFVCNVQIVERWYRYNYGEDDLDLCPYLSFGEWDSADASALATMLKTLIDAGAVHELEPDVRATVRMSPPSPEFAGLLKARSERKDNPPQPTIAPKGQSDNG